MDVTFRFNTDANANMFKELEENGKKSTFAKGFMAVEYTCLSCHVSRDKAWASEHATSFHGSK